MSGIIGSVGSKSGVIGTTSIDYEEGSWTPTINGVSSSPTQSYAYQVGRYTKTGNLVYATCSVEFSASGISGGSGHLQIKGFPFDFENVSLSGQGGIIPRAGGVSGGGPDSVLGSLNTGFCYCLNSVQIGSGSATFIQAGSAGNGAFMYATITYRTNY
tara:strand:+ start:512 stop:985 length:474 start_codon:yes stop_codon:yes gene_type:complete